MSLNIKQYSPYTRTRVFKPKPSTQEGRLKDGILRTEIAAFQGKKWRQMSDGTVGTSMAIENRCTADRYGNPRVKVCTCKSVVSYVKPETLERRDLMRQFAAKSRREGVKFEGPGGFLKAFKAFYDELRNVPATPPMDFS